LCSEDELEREDSHDEEEIVSAENSGADRCWWG
jgi:hypothetical protein